jgi:site-specific DNA recombinase
MGAIATRLTAMHIPTCGDKQKHVAKKRGHGVWTQAMVRHILTNETYTGLWHFGKTRVVPKEEARKLKKKRIPRVAPNKKNQTKASIGEQVARPYAEWIPVTVPAIIHWAAFDAMRERMTLNRELAQRNRKHDYLMSGRLKCSKCGYSYVSPRAS